MISDYQIQNVLRTYQKQLRLDRLKAPKPKDEAPVRPDEVTISVEGKKKQIYEQVAAQVRRKLIERLNE